MGETLPLAKADKFHFETNYNEIIRNANDLLIHKEFAECLNVSKDAIEEARKYPELAV